MLNRLCEIENRPLVLYVVRIELALATAPVSRRPAGIALELLLLFGLSFSFSRRPL